MIHPPAEREQGWQRAAELEPRSAAEEPEVELYRQVYAAVRAAPLPEAPLGFAARMEREALAQAERRRRVEAVEGWGVRLGLALLLALLLVSVAPWLLPRLGGWSFEAPWLPVLGSGAALGLWSLVERRRVV